MVLNHLDVYNEESRMIIELAQVYRGILTEVRKADYSLKDRAYVSKWKNIKSTAI